MKVFRGLNLRLAIYLMVLVSISAMSQIATDGSLGPRIEMSGSEYEIGDNLGQIRGNNLFHSFREFNIRTGESATFTGPNSVRNILSRVTGANESFIDGELGSSIPGANVFFLNPNGVRFGANASLNVDGSFIVSTADYLRFTDDAEFHTDLSRTSQLTVAAPQAFGFLNGNPSPISVEESTLHVADKKRLSLIGGDIRIAGGTLHAKDGHASIVSVASSGEVTPNIFSEQPNHDVLSAGELGTIEMSESSTIDVNGSGGGTIVIRGGRFVIEGGGKLLSQSTQGLGGRIDVNVKEMHLRDRSQIIAEPTDNGSGGEIAIETSEVITLSDSTISSRTSGPGNAGIIRLSAPTILLEKGDVRSDAMANSTGNAGAIRINNVDDLTLKEGSVIAAGTSGIGNAGEITIEARETATLSDSAVLSRTLGAGNAGIIRLSAPTILVEKSDIRVNTTTNSTGKAGAIRIKNVDNLTLKEGSVIFAGTGVNGSGAGEITIEAREAITISNSDIFSRTSGAGDAGIIRLSAPTIELEKSRIRATNRTPASTGNSGTIQIENTRDLSLREGSIIGTSSIGSGDAGRIQLIASNSIELSDSEIRNTNQRLGAGGEIKVGTKDLELTNGSLITSSAAGPADGGEIEITATGRVSLSDSEIFNRSFRRGDAGTTSIMAHTLNLTNGAVINSSTPGGGRGAGGKIKVEAIEMVQISNSMIVSQSQMQGNAGEVNIITKDLSVTNGGEIRSSTQGNGDGGVVRIDAKDTITISGGDSSSERSSGIFTNSGINDEDRVGQGKGGNIVIRSNDLFLSKGGVISANSITEGDAGNIRIDLINNLFGENTTITTSSAMADGGNIEITSTNLTHLINSSITAEVQGGQQTVGGNITMTLESAVLERSEIIANAEGGRGGNISIAAHVFVADPGSRVDASSESGIDGFVNIQAPIVSISEDLAPLTREFLIAPDLLKVPCEARLSGGSTSSFVLGGRQTRSVMPGTLLPTSFIFGEGFLVAEKVVK